MMRRFYISPVFSVVKSFGLLIRFERLFDVFFSRLHCRFVVTREMNIFFSKKNSSSRHAMIELIFVEPRVIKRSYCFRKCLYRSFVSVRMYFRKYSCSSLKKRRNKNKDEKKGGKRIVTKYFFSKHFSLRNTNKHATCSGVQ